MITPALVTTTHSPSARRIERTSPTPGMDVPSLTSVMPAGVLITATPRETPCKKKFSMIAGFAGGFSPDRKGVVYGKSVSGQLARGGRSVIKTKKTKIHK